MEKLQINLIALEQAVIYTLLSFLFFFRKIFRYPLSVYSHTFPISYFLFAFAYLRALLRLDKSETEEKWPELLVSLGIFLKSYGEKKFQFVFVVPYFWSIVIKLKYLPHIAK